MKQQYFILVILCPLLSMCQPITIKGKVMNEEGEVVAGAVVKLRQAQGVVRWEGPSHSPEMTTMSDERGEFIFTNARMNDTIFLSAVGYKPAWEVNNERGLVTITLKRDVRTMGGVVVSTGYQQLPKERVTGSFALINQEQLSRVPSSSLLQRLDGTSNILFDKRNANDVRLQLRGLYTLTNSITQPLIIVDHFPFTGDIESINPNDVKSVTLLKDASAASVWGARAGNGVIVISMKKGRYNQPQRVTVTANCSVTPKPDLDKLPELSSSAIVDLELFLFNKGFYDAAINNSSTRPPLTPLTEVLALRRSGLISAADSAAQVAAFRSHDVRSDFERYLYRAAITQQYALNLSGGSARHSYYFSAGFDRNQTALGGDDNQRFTFRSGSTFRLHRNFTASTLLGFTQGLQGNNSPGAYGSTSYQLGSHALPRYVSLVNPDGSAAALATRYRGSFTDTVGGGKLLDWAYRPLDELEFADNHVYTQAWLADVNLQYRITSFLTAEAQYRYQRNQSLSENNYSLASFMARDLINLYTNLAASSAALRNPVPVGGILDRAESLQQAHNGRVQLNLDYAGRDYRVVAVAGAELRGAKTEANQNRVYGYDQRLNVSAVDYTSNFPRIVGGAANIPFATGVAALTDRFVSLFTNAAFTWKQRYTISASGRRDASNLFGVHANDKWKPFWSAGAAWNIAAEPFYTSQHFPQLLARFSYGFSGNVDQSQTAYTLISYNSSASNSPIFLPYAQVLSPPNPDLRWEKVSTLNIGVDFQYRDWLSGSMEYYRKRSVDVLAGQQVDASTGFNSLIANTAHITGSGAEIQFVAKWLRGKCFKWQSDILFNYAAYKVTRYLLNKNTDGYTSSGAVINPIAGYNPYLLVSYRWAGLDPSTGNPMGYVNGQLSTDYATITNKTALAEQVIHGPALPPVFGNLLNTVSYKQVSFSFNILYRLGHYFRRPTISYSSLFAAGDGHIDYLRRWQQPGDELYTQVPSMLYPNPSVARDVFYTNSEVTVSKAGYIRLHDCRVSYDALLGKHPSANQRCSFFLYTSNLNLLLWKANKEGPDSEFPAGGKPPASFSFGINLYL